MEMLDEENIYTSEINGRVRIRTDLDNSVPIRTVPQFVDEAVHLCGHRIALSWQNDGDKTWKHINYHEYKNKIRTCAKAFLNLGLERYNGVCILGYNSPEWFISDLAAIYAGGIAAGIYITNLPDSCYHCCSVAKANIVVVGDTTQLEKILQIRDRLPDLKAIVQISGNVESQPNLYSWEEIIELGKSLSDNNLNEVIETLRPNECCTLVFTSGTTDYPKAVMLSHDNLIYDASVIIKYHRASWEYTNVIVSFLPLSHVAAQVVDIYSTLFLRAHVYFADKTALKGTLIDTLTDVQPTQFLTVPRVWEKMYEKISGIAAKRNCFVKCIVTWAKSQGLAHNTVSDDEQPICNIGYNLASAFVFKRIKKALGFSRCLNFLSSAAPLSLAIKKYFASIDIRILEAFGMSEASGAHTMNTNYEFCIDGVGKSIPGTQTKIHNPDEMGKGEICLRGRNIFMGYLNNLSKTSESIDEDGWLHSGDLGYIDNEGFLHITGRIKELIITAGGENVAPVPIENNIKAELPFISHAVVVGDARKFLSVLLTLKTEHNSDGKPTDHLSSETIERLKELGSQAVTVTEILQNPHPRLVETIQRGIDLANKKAISNVQKIKKFSILPKDFSIMTGELTPTMKLKRHVINKKYEKTIQKFYES